MRQAIAHYDESYFSWQKKSAVLTAKIVASRPKSNILPSDCVLDFGCGGGFLLAELNASQKLGVEINPVAREQVISNGADCNAIIEDVPDLWADIILSNSCLEHVESPLVQLQKMKNKLKIGGQLIEMVPHETLASKYQPNDVNQHLYTWSPMTLGNLVTLAGFQVKSVKLYPEVRPPFAEYVYSLFGVKILRLASRLFRVIRVMLGPIRSVDIDGDIMVVAERKT